MNNYTNQIHKSSTKSRYSLLLFLLLLGLLLTSCKTSSTTKDSKKDDTEPIQSTDLYVSHDATTDGDGSLESPTTLEQALTSIVPGQTIYLLGGTYTLSQEITIGADNNGEATLLKRLVAYQDELVTFDFSSQAYDSIDVGKNPRGLKLDGSYWHIKGITIYGAADNGMFISGSHNIIEMCVTKGNRDTGLQISRRDSSQSSIEEWPSHNLILNCTSYDNADPDNYEDADGFAAKLTSGEGNVFDGCIAYHNVDDGWDLYTKVETGPIGSVTIKNSLAFNNGVTSDGTASIESDGNGFKLGGANIPVVHYVINSAAFNNKAAGFTDNSNPGVISLVNCTSFNNSQAAKGEKNNFDFARAPYSSNGFVNLLSFSINDQTRNDKYRGVGTKSIFYMDETYYKADQLKWLDSEIEKSMGDITDPITENDFVSLTAPDASQNMHQILRNPDGTVNLGDFLKLSETSLLNTAGVDEMAIGAIFHMDYTKLIFPTPPEQSPVVVEEPEDVPELEPEDASKNIPPTFNPDATSGIIYTDGFDAATNETLHTPEYLANSEDPTIPLYIKSGGTPTVGGGYLTLDSARMTIGSNYLTTQSGTTPQGVFDLSKPYRLTIEIAGASGLEAKKFMVYIDNNTTGMNNSVHKEVSKIYEVNIGELPIGDLVFEPEIGTTTSFIQLRVETGAKVSISKIILEYLD